LNDLIDRQKGEKGSVDIPGQTGVPAAWQNTSPELAAILENLKRTEQHLKGEHKCLIMMSGGIDNVMFVNGALMQCRKNVLAHILRYMNTVVFVLLRFILLYYYCMKCIIVLSKTTS